MNEKSLTIQLDNVRPDCVIYINGVRYENAPYIHLRDVSDESLNVRLYCYDQLVHEQVFVSSTATQFTFTAPDITVITCATMLGDSYYLNGKLIEIPYPVTYFDGATFELSRRRSASPDVTITIKGVLGVCDVSSLLDYAGFDDSIASSPKRDPAISDDTHSDLTFDTEYVTPNSGAVGNRSVTTQSGSSEADDVIELDQHQDDVSEDQHDASKQQTLLPESFRRVIFENVPNDFEVFVSGRKLSSNQCLVDLASTVLPKRYDVRSDGAIVGSFPLIITEGEVTYVSIPDFVKVIGLNYERCRVYINDNLVRIPCWVPVTNRRSIHVRVAVENNEFFYERTIQITSNEVVLPDVGLNDFSNKRLQTNSNSASRTFTTLIHKLAVIQDTLSCRIGLTLFSLFLTMLFIRYAREAPRWLPLVLIILMNTLIWTKSTSESKSNT